MTALKYAVKVKINSIQDYIFLSNKLKENIGASQITDKEVFRETMEKEILSNWKLGGFKIGDIGGGGALVLFENEAGVKSFIKVFSATLLLKFPGLKTSFAIMNDFDFQSHKKLLDEQLTENKNKFHVNTTIPKHGITADCPWSNESAEEWSKEEENFLSKVTTSKIKYVSKSLLEYQSKIPKNLDFTLTNDIEKLGQNKEAGYIAVVHVDGNGMGNKINKIESLELLGKRSEDITTARETALENTFMDLIDVYNNGKLNDLDLQKLNGKIILPIRPLIGGGDDITFVCEGRLGIYLAEKFVGYFSKNNSDLMDGACAGVAIVKTKFPFYKAYQLAEQLCKEAKKKSRGTNNSYLSYYYSATTFSGNIEQLRARTHELPDGKNLYNGPYNIFEHEDADSLQNLKKGIYDLVFSNKTAPDSKKSAFPKNKAMLLREVLVENESTQALFVKELAEAKLNLPGNNDIPSNTTKLWNTDNKTPFFDQIELMDFYPEALIDLNNEN